METFDWGVVGQDELEESRKANFKEVAKLVRPTFFEDEAEAAQPVLDFMEKSRAIRDRTFAEPVPMDPNAPEDPIAAQYEAQGMQAPQKPTTVPMEGTVGPFERNHTEDDLKAQLEAPQSNFTIQDNGSLRTLQRPGDLPSPDARMSPDFKAQLDAIRPDFDAPIKRREVAPATPEEEKGMRRADAVRNMGERITEPIVTAGRAAQERREAGDYGGEAAGILGMAAQGAMTPFNIPGIIASEGVKASVDKTVKDDPTVEGAAELAGAAANFAMPFGGVGSINSARNATRTGKAIIGAGGLLGGIAGGVGAASQEDANPAKIAAGVVSGADAGLGFGEMGEAFSPVAKAIVEKAAPAAKKIAGLFTDSYQPIPGGGIVIGPGDMAVTRFGQPLPDGSMDQFAPGSIEDLTMRVARTGNPEDLKLVPGAPGSINVAKAARVPKPEWEPLVGEPRAFPELVDTARKYEEYKNFYPDFGKAMRDLAAMVSDDPEVQKQIFMETNAIFGPTAALARPVNNMSLTLQAMINGREFEAANGRLPTGKELQLMNNKGIMPTPNGNIEDPARFRPPTGAGLLPDVAQKIVKLWTDGVADVKTNAKTPTYSFLIADQDTPWSVIDTQMARIYGYTIPGDALRSSIASRYMQTMDLAIADELGWAPHEVQSALWFASKDTLAKQGFQDITLSDGSTVKEGSIQETLDKNKELIDRWRQIANRPFGAENPVLIHSDKPLGAAGRSLGQYEVTQATFDRAKAADAIWRKAQKVSDEPQRLNLKEAEEAARNALPRMGDHMRRRLAFTTGNLPEKRYLDRAIELAQQIAPEARLDSDLDPVIRQLFKEGFRPDAPKYDRIWKTEFAEEPSAPGFDYTPGPAARRAEPVEALDPNEQQDGESLLDYIRRTSPIPGAGIFHTVDNPMPIDEAVESIADIHASSGGSTFNMYDGDLVGANGYAVAYYPERGAVIDGQATPDDIRAFITKNKDILTDPENAVGTWFNPEDGKSYLDISRVVPNRAEAIRLGREKNQIAVMNLRNLEEVPTGGTGAIPGSGRLGSSNTWESGLGTVAGGTIGALHDKEENEQALRDSAEGKPAYLGPREGILGGAMVGGLLGRKGIQALSKGFPGLGSIRKSSELVESMVKGFARINPRDFEFEQGAWITPDGAIRVGPHGLHEDDARELGRGVSDILNEGVIRIGQTEREIYVEGLGEAMTPEQQAALRALARNNPDKRFVFDLGESPNVPGGGTMRDVSGGFVRSGGFGRDTIAYYDPRSGTWSDGQEGEILHSQIAERSNLDPENQMRVVVTGNKVLIDAAGRSLTPMRERAMITKTLEALAERMGPDADNYTFVVDRLDGERITGNLSSGEVEDDFMIPGAGMARPTTRPEWFDHEPDYSATARRVVGEPDRNISGPYSVEERRAIQARKGPPFDTRVSPELRDDTVPRAMGPLQGPEEAVNIPRGPKVPKFERGRNYPTLTREGQVASANFRRELRESGLSRRDAQKEADRQMALAWESGAAPESYFVKNPGAPGPSLEDMPVESGVPSVGLDKPRQLGLGVEEPPRAQRYVGQKDPVAPSPLGDADREVLQGAEQIGVDGLITSQSDLRRRAGEAGTMAQKLRYSSMLAGTASAIGDIISNTVSTVKLYPRTAIAATFEEGLQALGVINKADRATTFSELGAMHAAVGSGIMHGWKKAVNAMLEGSNPVNKEMPTGLVKGKKGLLLETGQRLRIAADVLAQELGETMGTHMLAYRQATREGFKYGSREYVARTQQLVGQITNALTRGEVEQGGTALRDSLTGAVTPDALAKEVKSISRRLIFQQEQGELAKKIGNLRAVDGNKPDVISLMVPFYRTIANIASEGVTMTPGLGAAGIAKDLVNGGVYAGDAGSKFARTNTAAVLPATQRAADQALGVAMAMGAAVLVSQGLMTGSGPADRKEREAMREEGWQPYSMKVGDSYVPVTKVLGPLAFPLVFGASLQEARMGERGFDQEALDQFVGAVQSNWFTQSGLRAFDELLSVAGGETDAKQSVSRAVAGMAGSFVPQGGLLRAAATGLDENVRDPKSVLDYIRTSIPGASGEILGMEEVAAKRDDFGNEVKRYEGQKGYRSLLPFQSSEDRTADNPRRFFGSESAREDLKIERAIDKFNKWESNPAIYPRPEPDEMLLAMRFMERRNDAYTEARKRGNYINQLERNG